MGTDSVGGQDRPAKRIEVIEGRTAKTVSAWIDDQPATRRDQIIAWHTARVTNGPTETMNNLIKKIKWIGFGFRRYVNYRIRVLLYAGRVNRDLLDTVIPR